MSSGIRRIRCGFGRQRKPIGISKLRRSHRAPEVIDVLGFEERDRSVGYSKIHQCEKARALLDQFRGTSEPSLFFELTSQPFAQDHFVRSLRIGMCVCDRRKILGSQRDWNQASREDDGNPLRMCLQSFGPFEQCNHLTRTRTTEGAPKSVRVRFVRTNQIFCSYRCKGQKAKSAGSGPGDIPTTRRHASKVPRSRISALGS